MPQLDFASYPTQIFWTLVSFGLMLWLMSKIALPRVTDVMEERENRIGADLDKASQQRNEAEAVQQAFEDKLERAQDDARALISDTLRSWRAEEAEKLAAANNDAAAELRAAEGRIDAAKAAALASVKEIAGETAVTVTNRLTGWELGQSDVAGAVDTALKGKSHA